MQNVWGRTIRNFVVIIVIMVASFVPHAIGIEQLQKNMIYSTNNCDEGFCKEINEVIRFSEPIILENEKYNQITMKDADTYLNNPGQPVLPIITKTYILPIGTIISQISCYPKSVQKKLIDKELVFAHNPISLSKTYSKIYEDNAVYKNDSFYPSTWFDYHIGIGLNGKEHVIYLTIRLYPVRYYPIQQVINYANNMEINIDYKPPKSIISFPDEYDLVIISPSKFSSNIQPLIAHKETMNVKTNLVTTEDIYSQYEGRDQQEKIKYFIKHAVEDWGISYVLLFGGMNGQNIYSWNVPIRYSRLSDGGESKHISDLYYSDIYKYDEKAGFIFDDWDSNDNNIFAEWYAFISSEKPYTRSIVDILDLYPDVYIGRLPCRYTYEVKNIVDRIINYETTTYGKDWFKTMVVLGGDNANESLYLSNTTDYYEGEMMNSQALNFMDGFNHIRIWPEDGDEILTADNAEKILSVGEGFAYFAGHGTPFSWETHPHGQEYKWIEFSQGNIKNLKNGEKLPIVIVSGCHNCQFDTSPLRFITDGVQSFSEYLFVPKCWGWCFASLRNGGSIATIGHTGLSYYGAGEGQFFESQPSDGIPDCIQYFDGWLEPHFFKLYNHDNIEILGQVHGQTLIDYLNQFPIDWNIEMGVREKQATMYDCKTIQEWVLFGDPSLKMGGYPQEIRGG